ncbi:ribokinase [Bifidobacterium coryneforme]|uniref:ribokinase n=1 Tax=Bifidobacterium TaxID=1678 RepID=UPI0004E5DE84|nr:PfkB family ribokinase [Bifidobacterium coryneforme]
MIQDMAATPDQVLQGLDTINGSISVVGSMNADYTVTTDRLPNPGETINGGPLQILPGGKSANQAAAAARIGAHVQLFGAVGSDPNADFLLGQLGNAGVDTSQVMTVPGPSGTTVITVDAQGENTIVYSPGSNAKVDVDYAHRSQKALTSAKVLGLCLESPIETVTEAARMGHEAGMTVLLNDSPFRADLPADLIAYSDLILVNEHEMAQLLGIDEPEDGDWTKADWDRTNQTMQDFGFHRAIVTLGGEGSMVLDQGKNYRIHAVKVDAVDTTGCGDAFMGTILAGLSSGMSLVESAQLASYVSAYAATGQGAQASYGSAEQIRYRFA